MPRRFGNAICISAALIAAVNASTWWPETQQNTWWPNATMTAATNAPTSTSLAQGGGSPGLSMELGGYTVALYEPAPLTAATNPDLSQATPLSSVPDGSECSIFAGEVNVYYFPTATPKNTNCYTGTGAPPPPSEIAKPVYPSVYVVVSSLSAGNSHTRIGNIYPSAIFSMLPNELSTIAGTAGPSAAAVFNFADLPCPPPAVAAADSYFYNPEQNPTRPYMPRIVPPSQILEMDPAWASCTFPANFQFFDPPSSFAPGSGGEGPGDKKRDLKAQAPQAMVTLAPAPIDFHRGHPRQVAP